MKMFTRSLFIVLVVIGNSYAKISVQNISDIERKEIQDILLGGRRNFTKCVNLNNSKITANLVAQNQSRTDDACWTVGIYKKKRLNKFSIGVQECSGSLIHPKVVLTAAHCVQNATLNRLKVFARNSHPIPTTTNANVSSVQKRQIESIAIHDTFNATHPKRDIALIFLQKPFKLSFGLTTVCLLKSSIDLSYVQCVGTNWKALQKQSNLSIVPREKCQQVLRFTDLRSGFKLNKGFMCANRGNYDWILDGGAPLTCSICGKSGQMVQVGLMSWGFDDISFPYVLTSVREYRNWISKMFKERKLKLETCNFKERTVNKNQLV